MPDVCEIPVYRPSEDILRPARALSPEGRRIPPQLTVEEKLCLGAYIRDGKQGISEDMDWAFSLFPRLRERARQNALLIEQTACATI